MLTFANPSALFALLGLLVPLAIHLWNRRPSREVAVGSLRWLAAAANRRLRNLRLEQLGLLLLRAALLAVLAGAVAGPTWRQPLPPGRGQVLISPELAGQGVLASVRPRLDSLRRRGYAVRWLRQGWPLVSPAAWRADSLDGPTADSASYWSRIQLAADTFAGQPLYVLTPARLAAMPGTHRPLPPGIVWQTLPLPAETIWLQAATGTADSLYLLLGHSTERQTAFRTVRVARPQPERPVAIPGGQAAPRYVLINNYLKPTDLTQPAVPVQRAARRAWVYAPPAYAAEARYLRAALRAASASLPGSLAFTVAPTLPDTATAPDWLFWLPSEPVPAAWRRRVPRGLHLWQAAAGAGTADTTLLVAPLLAAAPVAVWRRTELAAAAGQQTLWADAQGRAMLTRRPVGLGALYQVATRLDPAWSTLPDNAALPALLLDVLQPAPAGAGLARLRTHDQRRLDPVQLPATVALPVAKTARPAAFRLVDLRPWLVLLSGLLLALERWLARRRAGSTLSYAA